MTRDAGHAWRLFMASSAVLDELNRGNVSGSGWRLAADAHHRLLVEIGMLLSPELLDELRELVAPFTNHELSPDESLVAHAQLVGWLGGLVEGILAGVTDFERANP